MGIERNDTDPSQSRAVSGRGSDPSARGSRRMAGQVLTDRVRRTVPRINLASWTSMRSMRRSVRENAPSAPNARTRRRAPTYLRRRAMTSSTSRSLRRSHWQAGVLGVFHPPSSKRLLVAPRLFRRPELRSRIPNVPGGHCRRSSGDRRSADHHADRGADGSSCGFERVTCPRRFP